MEDEFIAHIEGVLPYIVEMEELINSIKRNYIIKNKLAFAQLRRYRVLTCLITRKMKATRDISRLLNKIDSKS